MKAIRIVALMVLGAVAWELIQLLWGLGVFHAINDFATQVGRWSTTVAGWVVMIVLAIIIPLLVVKVIRLLKATEPESETKSETPVASDPGPKQSTWLSWLKPPSADKTDKRRDREEKLAESVKIDKSA